MNPAGWAVDLSAFVPELILTAGLLVLLVLNLVFKRSRGTMTAIGGAILLVIVGLVSAAGDESVGTYLFGSVVQDGVTVFFRIFFCVATLLSLGMLLFTFRDDGEPYLLVLSGMLGMFLLAGANDLITLFVSLELVSIPSYVLAGYKRNDMRSAEASLKYVLYGAVSSGLMVYGFSFLYGLTGTTNLADMAARMAVLKGSDATVLLGLLLVLAGIGYKIAMVPFHFWCPDVYEGSPTAITAFFSVVPKAAGFAALFRLMPIFLPLNGVYGVSAVSLFSLASAVTMTFGNLGALWQTSLKRMLAYSSIAHAGYVLMGFAVLASNPVGEFYSQTSMAILFYLAAYLFMNLGAFLIVLLVERQVGTDSISHFRGLGKVQVIPALLLAVFLFSLTGIPPMAGFTGKFLLFAALIHGKLWALAIIGAGNTVISLYYYIRVIRDMYLADPLPDVSAIVIKAPRMGSLTGVLSLATVIPTLLLGLWWGPLAEWIRMKMW